MADSPAQKLSSQIELQEELLLHIQSNDLQAAKSAIERGARVGSCIEQAVTDGNADMVDLLLKSGAVLDAQNHLGHALCGPDPWRSLRVFLDRLTPQQINTFQLQQFLVFDQGSAPCSPMDLLDSVLKKHPQPAVFLNQMDDANVCPLQHAIIWVKKQSSLYGDNDQDLLEFMLDRGALCTPNVLVTAACSIEDLSLFLRHGPPVNLLSSNGDLALNSAAQKGWVENCSQLLEAGADIHAKNKSGATALLSGAPHPEVVEFLLEKGANLLDVNNTGENLVMGTALTSIRWKEVFDIVLKQDPETVKTLFSQTSHDQKNMMHVACSTGVIGWPKMQFFLNGPLGSSLINSRNALGETPLMVACVGMDWGGDCSSVKALLDAGANINAQDNQGFTALMKAMKSPPKDAFEMLLIRGADPSICNRFGRNALDEAIESDHVDCIAHLVAMGTPINGNPSFMRPDRKKRVPDYQGENHLITAMRTKSPAFLQFHLRNQGHSAEQCQEARRFAKRSKERSEMLAIINSHIAQQAMDDVIQKNRTQP